MQQQQPIEHMNASREEKLAMSIEASPMELIDLILQRAQVAPPPFFLF
jgi:hypothetical protein